MNEVKNIKDLLKIIIDLPEKVFIIGHNKADLDSLAAAIGLQTLCEELGKQAYIILDEPLATMEPIVKKLRAMNLVNHNIITLSLFETINDNPSGLIVTDANKKESIVLGEHLDSFEKVVVIDHHNPGETTIQNAALYIPLAKGEDETLGKVKVSSASEIVTQLLLLAKVDCSKDIYTYLYGGIYLDTNRFDRNIGEKTYDTAHKLCAKGADIIAVKELFLASFDEDKEIYNLMFNGTVLKAFEYDIFNNYMVGFTLNRENPKTIYKRETLAKAADRMMQYRLETEFAIGYIDAKTISISARSKGRIDVGRIMEKLGGGGNPQNAAAQVPANVDDKEITLEEIESMLSLSVEHGIKVGGEMLTATDTAVISTPKQLIKKTTES